MSGRTTARSVSSVPTDPFYSSVSLLLHGDGTNGSTTFTDNSPSPKTASFAGTTQISTAQVKYGTGSIVFPGGGTAKLFYTDNADFNFGTGDFTIETWVYFNAVNVEQVVVQKGWQDPGGGDRAPFLVYMTNTGSLRFNSTSVTSSWNIANERVIGTMTAGVWRHIAVTRTGTTFRAFVDGVINNAFTFTSSSSLLNDPAQELYVGSRLPGSATLDGYIDDLRLTKGVSRYTATFTPPTAAFPNS